MADCSIWLRVPPSPPRIQVQALVDHVGRDNVVLHLLPCSVRGLRFYWPFIAQISSRKDGAKFLVIAHFQDSSHLTLPFRVVTLGKRTDTDTASTDMTRMASTIEFCVHRPNPIYLLYIPMHYCISTSGFLRSVSNFLATWLMKLSNSPRSFPWTQTNSSTIGSRPELCRASFVPRKHRIQQTRAGELR